MEFAEFQNFGWNILTMGFIGTVLVTLFETYGLGEQIKTIYRIKSCESISVSLFCYLTSMFMASILYGVYISSMALIFTGVILTAMHIPIVIGLWKFKGFKKWEKIICLLFATMVLGLVIIPFKAAYFFTISIGTVIFIAHQAYEILSNKNSGAIEIKLIYMYLMGTGFWVIYSFALGNPVLEILNLSSFIFLIAVTILWYRYRDFRAA